jgi:hypothetical protein
VSDAGTNLITYFIITTTTIIIIIIIIWHYNPLWVFTFSAKSVQVLLSSPSSFYLSAFLDLPWHLLVIIVLVFLLVWFP